MTDKALPSIPSPCLSICSLDLTDEYCVGCGRSLDEIARWGAASEAQRRAILEKLPERLSQLKS
jgi:uncharacterized protein